MKKILLLAIAGIALFLTSCEKEIDPSFVRIDGILFDRIPIYYPVSITDHNKAVIQKVKYVNSNNDYMYCRAPMNIVHTVRFGSRYNYNFRTGDTMGAPSETMLNKINELNDKYNDSDEYFVAIAEAAFIINHWSMRDGIYSTGYGFLEDWHIARISEDSHSDFILEYEYYNANDLPE